MTVRVRFLPWLALRLAVLAELRRIGFTVPDADVDALVAGNTIVEAG